MSEPGAEKPVLPAGAASISPPNPSSAAPKPLPSPEGNPAFRMLGLPRLRARLPSRNWAIFLTIVGSWTGAVLYDRRNRKREQQRWCNAVSHLSQQSLDPQELPRTLTVFLAGPPGDGLRPAREHFRDYVRPVLVSAGVDWEVVEGRKEGDVREKVAERIRRERKKTGEEGGPTEEEGQDVVREMRERQGIKAADRRGGDLVLGRHAWKEYIRGVHEGWLGPLQDPREVEKQAEEAAKTDLEDKSQVGDGPVLNLESLTDSTTPSSSDGDDASPTANQDEVKAKDGKEKEKEQKPAKPGSPPPFISSSDYPSASLPPSFPESLPPSIAVPLPHLLGIGHTPARMYRFLTRRHLAADAGQSVATLLLADESRGYTPPASPSEARADPGDGENARSDAPALRSDEDGHPPPGPPEREQWEQARLLQTEERDWHKTAWKARAAGLEAVWRDPVVVDPRVGGRMTVPVVAAAASSSGDGAAAGTELDERARPLPGDEGRNVRGNARDWSGGKDHGRVLGWGQWFREAAGFGEDEERKARGRGAKDGLAGEDGA